MEKNEKNNVTIAFNILYSKNEKIYPAYISKHNSNSEKEVVLLTISNGQKQWHYLAVKKLSTLSRGLTSHHCDEFYCLNCLHSLRTKNKLESHKKVCENKNFCNLIMPSEDTKILEFNKYQKSD